MAFDTNGTLEYAEAEALSVGLEKIPIDQSALFEVYEQLPPSVGITQDGGVPCFNNSEVRWDVRFNAKSRYRLDKSFFRVQMHAQKTAAGVDGDPIDVAHVSIPFNTQSALFRRVELRWNQAGATVEALNQNFDHAAMAKVLTRFTKQALETMHDNMFTPCIESTRDMLSGLSVESASRAQRWFSGTGKVSKNIPLCDLFDSCRIPAASYLMNMQVLLNTKMTTEILFADQTAKLADEGSKLFIDDITLYLCRIDLTPEQAKQEEAKIKGDMNLMNQTFTIYDARMREYTTGASFRDSNARNVQSAMVMIPSTAIFDNPAAYPLPASAINTVAMGINPFQYVYGSANGGTTGINAMQMRYDGIMSPITSMVIDTANPKINNSHLYALYRNECVMMTDRDLSPAVGFDSMCQGLNGPVVPGPSADANPYVLFCAQFYPKEAAPHKTMAGSDLTVILGGGVKCMLITVFVRNAFVSVTASQDVFVSN